MEMNVIFGFHTNNVSADKGHLPEKNQHERNGENEEKIRVYKRA